MPSGVFDRWVSLGNYCLPKFQINRHIARTYFGLAENSTAKAHGLLQRLPDAEVRAINGGNLLLDWCVVENYNQLIDLFERGLDDALVADTLEEVVGEDGAIGSIRCLASGLCWPHLFSDEERRTGWRDHIPAARAKIAHLAGAFKELRHFRTLYIMTESLGFARTDAPDRIAAALGVLRGAAAAEFQLLVCIPEPHDLADRDRVTFPAYDTTPDLPAYGYLGNAAAWDAVFAPYALSAPVA